MQLEPHVEALRAELASLAALGDENVAAAGERLSRALGSTLGLRLLELLSEAALAAWIFHHLGIAWWFGVLTALFITFTLHGVFLQIFDNPERPKRQRQPKQHRVAKGTRLADQPRKEHDEHHDGEPEREHPLKLLTNR